LTCASAPCGASGLHRCRFSEVQSEWIWFHDRGPSVNANVRAKIEKLAAEKHERVMLERLLNELSKIAFGRELLDFRLDLAAVAGVLVGRDRLFKVAMFAVIAALSWITGRTCRYVWRADKAVLASVATAAPASNPCLGQWSHPRASLRGRVAGSRQPV
jgi:hypothetical protein